MRTEAQTVLISKHTADPNAYQGGCNVGLPEGVQKVRLALPETMATFPDVYLGGELQEGYELLVDLKTKDYKHFDIVLRTVKSHSTSPKSQGFKEFTSRISLPIEGSKEWTVSFGTETGALSGPSTIKATAPEEPGNKSWSIRWNDPDLFWPSL